MSLRASPNLRGKASHENAVEIAVVASKDNDHCLPCLIRSDMRAAEGAQIVTLLIIQE